jgi:hypothetical protein
MCAWARAEDEHLCQVGQDAADPTFMPECATEVMPKIS